MSALDGRPSPHTDSKMLEMLQELVGHKVWANASLVRAVRGHEAAAADDDLRVLLHHIIVADRFWFATNRGREFDAGRETDVPRALDEVARRFRETHDAELRWIAQLDERELERQIETTYIPGRRYSVAQAVMQVCLHSHGHRAQAATRLRSLGGTPPPMDYVLWLRERPAATWD